MNRDKFVFAQFADFLDHNKFRRFVGKYNGDVYVKHFTCWNQLLTQMFGQLSGRESLRDLVTVLEAHKSKCYHLGLGDRSASRNAVSLVGTQIRPTISATPSKLEQFLTISTWAELTS